MSDYLVRVQTFDKVLLKHSALQVRNYVLKNINYFLVTFASIVRSNYDEFTNILTGKCSKMIVNNYPIERRKIYDYKIIFIKLLLDIYKNK